MYERILVGTDGSKTAGLAVDRPVEVAQTLGSTLTIFSDGSPSRTREIVAAEAASALIERSERGDIDLLVVGNKGMTGPSRFLLGSVPNKVSHHAGVALLIVRTV